MPPAACQLEPRGQNRTFDNCDIGPAHLGQVIEDARSDHPATNYDNPILRLQDVSLTMSTRT